MKKLKEVEAFNYTYLVYDRFTRYTYGPYSSIEAACKEHGGYYSEDRTPFRTEYRFTGHHCEFCFRNNEDRDAPRLVMLRNEDDTVVSIDEIGTAFPRHNLWGYKNTAKENDHDRNLDLIYRRHHPAKLKEHFSSEKRISHWSDGNEEYWYRCKHIGNYHNLTGVYTTQKKDIALSLIDREIGHYEEDNESDVGGSYRINIRRRFSLSHSLWHYERTNGAHYVSKSWKHNSKRRKQWIPK